MPQKKFISIKHLIFLNLLIITTRDMSASIPRKGSHIIFKTTLQCTQENGLWPGILTRMLQSPKITQCSLLTFMLNDQRIEQALIRAHYRGIKLHIMVPGMGSESDEYGDLSQRASNELQKHGIKIKDPNIFRACPWVTGSYALFTGKNSSADKITLYDQNCSSVCTFDTTTNNNLCTITNQSDDVTYWKHQLSMLWQKSTDRR